MMAQQLRALVTLVEDLGSGPITNMVHNHPSFQFWGIRAFMGISYACGTQTHMQGKHS